MKTVIKTKYQYFLIPLTYFAVWIALTINYLYCGMTSKIIKTTIQAVLIWLVFMMLLPLYIEELLGWKFVNSTIFFWISTYVVSVPVSIYFINEQKRSNIQ